MAGLGRFSPFEGGRANCASIQRTGGAINSSEMRQSGAHAFSLIETMVAMAMIGVFFVGLYTAIATSTGMVRICQENQRVTQILSDRLDTIRLYNWTQMTNGFVLTNFTVGIDPSVSNSVPYYTGTVSIVRAPIATTYSTNLLQVTARVKWVSGKRLQDRSMTTYVAKYGMQSYIMR